MPETDLQKHAITESFLQPNFSSKIWQILTMGDLLLLLEKEKQEGKRQKIRLMPL